MELEDKFKFLGRLIAFDLKEKQQELMVQDKFTARLNLIDKDLVNGLMKTWLYQFAVIPSLAWPFQVYDFPLTFAMELEATAVRFLKKWMGLYKRADTGFLFRARDNLGLALTSPPLLLKQMQISKCHIIKHAPGHSPGLSSSLYLRRLERERKIVRRWKPCTALEDAEANLEFEIKFAGQTDRVGLGARERYKRNLTTKEKRKRLLHGVRKTADDKATIHSMKLAQQGTWTKWVSDVLPPDMKWKDLIFAKNPKLISFRMNALANCLPTPAMKLRWGFATSALCPLCNDSQGTQLHILSFCKVALTQGRYTWRHDSVLSNLEPFLRTYINQLNEKKLEPTPKRTIKFVKAGDPASKQKHLDRSHLLCEAIDWELQIDYKGKEIMFPPNICTTSLRPDIVIWSNTRKKVVIFELTCPAEENI